MNSSERVVATLSGQPVDRRPFTLCLSLFGARLTGCPLEQYYRDPAAYATGQMAVLDQVGPDILFSPFAFGAMAESFGSEVRWFKNQPPILRRPALDSVRSLHQLRIPNIDAQPQLLYLRESVRRMASQVKGKVPIAGVLVSPADLPTLFLGMENWMETVLFDPPTASMVLQLVTPFFIQMANALLEDGADFIVIPSVFLSPTVLPRAAVVELTLPATRTALADVRGPVVLHHGGGRFLNHADLIPGLPHVAGLVMDHEDSLDETRARVGPELTLLGGLNGPDLGALSATDVAAKARAVLENRKNDPRFILSTTGADVPLETPLENIRAMRDAVWNP